MKKTSLTTKLTIAVSLVSTLIILISGLVYSYFYYLLSEKDLQNYIIDQSRSITSEQVVYHQNEIMYRQNEKGETLSERLRNLGLSAIIMDTNSVPLGSYGIYNTVPKSSIPSTESVIENATAQLGRLVTPDNRLYNTYTLPLISQGTVVGQIQFAKETQVISKITSLNITLLVLILPLGALLNSSVVNLLLRRSLTPLNQLISHLKNTPPGDLPQKIPLVGLTHDEISNLTTTFNRLLDQVGESVEKQKDFIAHASHQLKTPITAAVSSLELAQSGIAPDSPSTKHILRVKTNLLTLNHTIDSLLAMSRLSAKKTAAKVAPYKFKPYLTTILTLHTRSATDKKITLTFRCPDSAKTTIPPEHIQIIVSNLLDNAVKFTPTHGQISLTCTIASAHIKLEVSDTGPGIPSEDQVKIFDRFYRSRTTSKTPGSGLGLALVKLVCDLHRLPISVTSHQNLGTTFTLLIPKS